MGGDPSPFQFRRTKRAQARFTDRIEPVEAFDAALEGMAQSAGQRDRAKVLQFYGVGGVGKSRLLQELERRLDCRETPSIAAKVDFDDESTRSPYRALLRIRNTAKADQRVDFRHFDFAYAIFFAKRNPDFAHEKRKLPFLEEAGVVGDVLSALDGFGIAGAVKGLIEQGHRLLERLSITGEAKAALQQLKTMSEREIEEALPDFLGYDLMRAAAGGKALVVFVDTYEALWPSHTSERDRYSRDAWVRRLAVAAPGALLVIAGREQLRWVELDGSWATAIETHLLNRLTEADAREFLNSTSIEDAPLIEKLVRISEGHPFYLDLCVDAYFEGRLTGANTEPASWPDNRHDLFERFARSIQDDELALLKCLAPLASYDLDFARAATRHFAIPLSDDRLAAHVRFSFVKVHGQEATIHEIMRRSLMSHTPPEKLAAIREFALQHYAERLVRAGDQDSDETFVRPLLVGASQLAALQNEALTDAWLALPASRGIEILQKRAATTPVLEALSAIAQARRPGFWPEAVRTAYADLTHLIGRYDDAVALLDDQLGGAPLDRIVSDDALAFALIRRFHHRMMLAPVGEIWEPCADVVPLLRAEGRALALIEATFLLGGNLGAARGRQALAAPWLVETIKLARASGNDVMMVRALRKWSDFLRMRGCLERATALMQMASTAAGARQLRRYGLYLTCSWGDLLRLKGEHDAARAMLDEARNGFAGANMEGWLGHTHLAEAAIAIDVDEETRAREALAAAQRYYDRTNHLWGKTQVALQGLRLDRLTGISSEDLGARARAVSSQAWAAGYERDAELALATLSGTISVGAAIAFL